MTRSFPTTAQRALMAALLLAPVALQAQTWEYKSYKKSGVGGQYDKDRFTTGTVSLEEKDGKAVFRMSAGALDACLRGDVPAQVERTPETTTIDLQISMAGCDPIRYVIRNDGSGGDRFVKRGDAWVKDRFDHALTPAK